MTHGPGLPIFRRRTDQPGGKRMKSNGMKAVVGAILVLIMALPVIG